MHWTITQGYGQVWVVIWEHAKEDCQTVVQALGAGVGHCIVGCSVLYCAERSVGLWVGNGRVGGGVGGDIGEVVGGEEVLDPSLEDFLQNLVPVETE